MGKGLFLESNINGNKLSGGGRLILCQNRGSWDRSGREGDYNSVWMMVSTKEMVTVVIWENE